MGDPKLVSSQRDSASSLRDSYSDFFDERPENNNIDGALYQKPSVFTRIGAWFNDVGLKFKTFFDGIGEGIQSAWTAVKRAFSSEDQAQQAMRNIHQPTDPDAREPFQSRESIGSIVVPETVLTLDQSSGTLPIADAATAIAADATDPATVSYTLQSAGDEATTTEGISPDISLQTSQHSITAIPLNHAVQTPVVLSDEDSFALFVEEFKQAKREGREFSGAGRQQFEDAAKRHAQQLRDAELARLNALGDSRGDYALGTDQALAIEVASALLQKPLPHQQLLELTGQTSVPSFSRQDMECFDAWVEWRETKFLPAGKAIDLDGAVRYANEFIKKNADDAERAKAPDIARRLIQAYDLIRDKDAYDSEMSVQSLLKSVEDARAEMSPVPLPAFPSGVTTLALQPINGGLQAYVIKNMINDSKRYFSAIRKAEEPDEQHKAQAILFAALWKAGKSDSKIINEMKAWNFFQPLDQLLDADKIKNDFK